MCYNKKCNIFKGSLCLKELEKNLHNIGNINSKFCINIDGIPFTSVKMCYVSLLTAFEAGYQATVLLLLSLKKSPAGVFNKWHINYNSKGVSLYFLLMSVLFD